MANVKLVYNPYFLKTALFVEETAITEDSPLAFVFGKFISKWLEPSGAWRGFFLELADAVGTGELKICFVGTAEDFGDLKTAADFAEKNFHLSIELEYLLDDNAQTVAGANQKLNALVNFLNAQPSTNDDNFLVNIRPALEKTLNDESTVEIISLVKNFPAQDILQSVAANPTIKIVVNEPNQNLMLTLLKAFAEIKRSLVLFVFDGEKISAPLVTEALRNVTQALGHGEYAQVVYSNLIFVCIDSEKIAAENIRNTLGACGFEEPKLFLVNSTFAELLQKKTFEQEKFTAVRETLSASDCKNFHQAPVSFALKTHYENKIARCREIIDDCAECLKFYGLHKPDEIEDAKRRRNEALNEIALINSNLPALEQTILTYFERYALPVIVRKIYLNVKKNFTTDKQDIDQKISDTNQDLQRLSGKIAAFNRQVIQENPCQKFLDAASLNFDGEAFEQFYRRFKEPPAIIHTLMEVPSAVPVVEKNLVGSTAKYIKLSDARKYLQTVNAEFEKILCEFIDASAAYLVAQLLTPARNAVAQLSSDEQSEFQDLIADFEKIISDKKFDVPAADFEFFTVLSYEIIGNRKYGNVEYVPVDQILSEYTKKAEQFLDKHRLKLKRAALNFLNEFNALKAEKKPTRPTHVQDNSHELQRLRQAIAAKERHLAIYKNNLIVLKNFVNELERLLEIKP